MEKPRAVLFDAYGTLFDVYSVGLLAEQMFPGHGERLAGVLERVDMGEEGAGIDVHRVPADRRHDRDAGAVEGITDAG